MNNQSQRAMDQDFLEGIDDQFQRLMKLNGSGKRISRSGPRSPEDRLLLEIVDQLHGLSKTQREGVLAFVQQLKQKGE